MWAQILNIYNLSIATWGLKQLLPLFPGEGYQIPPPGVGRNRHPLGNRVNLNFSEEYWGTWELPSCRLCFLSTELAGSTSTQSILYKKVINNDWNSFEKLLIYYLVCSFHFASTFCPFHTALVWYDLQAGGLPFLILFLGTPVSVNHIIIVTCIDVILFHDIMLCCVFTWCSSIWWLLKW